MLTSAELGTSSTKRAVVDQLTFATFEHYWPQIENALDQEPELWNGCHTKETIYDGVCRGLVQVWALAVEDVIELVLFTEVAQQPNGLSVLRIWWAFGVLAEHVVMLSEFFDKVAARLQCSRVEITGRKGFARLLAPIGAQYKCSTFSRDVRAVRGH